MAGDSTNPFWSQDVYNQQNNVTPLPRLVVPPEDRYSPPPIPLRTFTPDPPPPMGQTGGPWTNGFGQTKSGGAYAGSNPYGSRPSSGFDANGALQALLGMGKGGVAGNSGMTLQPGEIMPTRPDIARGPSADSGQLMQLIQQLVSGMGGANSGGSQQWGGQPGQIRYDQNTDYLPGYGGPVTETFYGQPNQSPVETYGGSQTRPVAQGVFGMPQGAVPGGDAIGYLRSLGMPIPDFLNNDMRMRPTDLGTSLQQLGNVSAPSLQALQRLNPSAQEFLAGFFETVLGIPMQDILFNAQQPWQGLGQGRKSRQRGSYYQ